MLTILLSCLIIITASIHIKAEYSGNIRHIYLFKPLTVALIILMVIFQAPSSYKNFVLMALLFSLAGDIFLMLPSDKFIHGLVSFLFAHIFYILAFTVNRDFTFSIASSIPYLIYGIVMLFIFMPHLGKMKIPVMIYMTVILVMAWQSYERWQLMDGFEPFIAFVGTLFFLASDSTLAANRFIKKFNSAQSIILITYYISQWMIAISV